jgi:saccharopine dehydrogenase-like NADP-dependent oxidoreductase
VNAAATLADRMHDASLTLKQLFYLGLDDDKTILEKKEASPADVLQIALEKKLALKTGEKDMVIMYHEIEFENQEKKFKSTSTLIAKGEDDVHTAMAKTVGLPLGIAAKLILDGTIKTKGFTFRRSKKIYEPVLKELRLNGISFAEQSVEI